MSDVVIQLQDIGKKYRIGVREGNAADTRPRPWHRFFPSRRAHPNGNTPAFDSPNRANGNGHLAPTEPEREIWALRNVSFEISQGQVVGVIGRNGSGKSTLLKVLSHITKPTEGSGMIRGRVGSLLEVGSGFHQELTGRENVYMNAAILGMRRDEIKRKFDEIVDFAEVERFIDTPVKHYSSGMHIRLGFAVAAHIEPEILLVDEVLSVGDAAFQKKCLRKIKEISQDGRTVLIVSHNLVTVSRLAARALWLHRGTLRADAACDDVVQEYLNTVGAESMNSLRRGEDDEQAKAAGLIIETHPDFGFAVERVVLKNGAGQETLQFEPGDALTVELHYDAKIRIERPYVWFSLDSKMGPAFSANMLLDGYQPNELFGQGVLRCTFKTLPLLPQPYTLRMAMRANDVRTGIVYPQEIAFLRVRGDMHAYGFRGEGLQDRLSNSVPVVVPYVWTLPDGTMHHVDLDASRARSDLQSFA